MSFAADELKVVQIFDGAKIDFVQLPLLSKKTERHHDLLPLTPRHKRVRKENIFAWNSSEVPMSSGDLCGLRLMSNLKRRISDPSGHPEAEKRTRMEDESYLTPLPPISAPKPKVQLPLSLRHHPLQMTKSFTHTHTRCMSEDLSNSQVELSRLSFI